MPTQAEIKREAERCANELNELGRRRLSLEVRTLKTLITELYNPPKIKEISSHSKKAQAEALKEMDEAFQRQADQINRKFGKPEIFHSKITWFKTFIKARALISSLKSLYAEAKKHCLAEIKTQQTQKTGVANDPEKDTKNAFKKDIQAYLDRVAPGMDILNFNRLSQHFSVMKDQQTINQMGTIYLAKFLLAELDKKGATI